MMAELSAWLLRKHCLQHADPLFDRDENGRAVFRCPECLHAWPILPGYEPRPLQPTAPDAVVMRESRAPVEPRRARPAPATRPAKVPPPRLPEPTRVM